MNCAYCGNTFIPTRRTQRFDSKNCNYQYYLQTRKPEKAQHVCANCGKQFNGKNDNRIKYCFDCRKIKHFAKNQVIYICLNCGKEYHPKEVDRNKYCSRACAYQHKAAKPKEKTEHRCIDCGKDISSRSKRCSECNKQLARIQAYKYKTKERSCAWCNQPFVPEYKCGAYACCCQEHKELMRKDVDRRSRRNSPSAKLHKGSVSKAKRLRIWTRDSNICQLCGKKMKMDKLDTISSGHPHPLAPTVDHIVPVSIAKQMGWLRKDIHAERNLQAAHFVCNIRKGNRSVGEQLRLC